MLIAELVAILLSIVASPDDVERLRATSPQYLDAESARVHLGATRAVELLTGEPHAAMLAIARGESNFEPGALMVERSGSLSCGVMQATAISRAECTAMRSSPIAGYYAGAIQLRTWRFHPKCQGSLACSLAGYAGGWKMIDVCRASGSSSCWRAVGARMKLVRAIDPVRPTSS